MINQIYLGAIGVLIVIIIYLGGRLHYADEKVIECRANTSIQETRYNQKIKNYDENIKDIGEYFSPLIEETHLFKRRSNETDCQASKRFFDRANYR